MSRLTPKELLDQRTMRYFIPSLGVKKGWRIRDYDKRKMADLSSRGVYPTRPTRGFMLLKAGKTYRDLQITYWREDIRDGLITKGEIFEGLPEWLRPIMKEALRGAFLSDEGSKFRYSFGMEQLRKEKL